MIAALVRISVRLAQDTHTDLDRYLAAVMVHLAAAEAEAEADG